jgi:hypothetical protein
MCYYKAMIVTPTKVLFLPNNEKHEDIITRFELDDKKSPPDFVRVEYKPFGANFMTDIRDWKFKIDQDTLPDWYNEEEVKIACTKIIEDIIKTGITEINSSLYLGSVTAIPEGFNPKVGGNLDLSSVTAIPEGFNPKVGGDLYIPNKIRQQLNQKKG